MIPRRFFTVEEAEAALPVVREELESMRECLAFLRRAGATAPHGGEGAELPDDEMPGSPMYAWALQQLEGAQRRVIHLGCEIRDVDRGLVDFPARHGDQVILLCWLEGDERVSWFHGTDAGFSGRRPLAELEPQA